MNPLEFLGEFQAEAVEKLDIIGAQLLRLERDATNPQPVREMFLAAHTIKGGAAMLRLLDVEALAHAVEDLLSALRDSQRGFDTPTADLLFQTVDELRTLVASAVPAAAGAEPEAATLALAERLRRAARGDADLPEVVASEHAPQRLARALVVDDSPTVRMLHTLLLQRIGYEVEAVADGRRALERALAEPFDIVVAGLRNRGLHGFELTRALRSERAYVDVPIILMSADASDDLAREAQAAGAHSLVRKASAEDERLTATVQALATA